MKKTFRIFTTYCLGISILFASASSFADNKKTKHNLKTIINTLKDGNRRFVDSQLEHPNQTLERRKEIISEQLPKAVVISCSDSRVPPEIIFDQGLGDLFVIRVAGNVLDDINIGSAEYAVSHAGVSLIVVMGHKKCGAVTAAVKGGEIPEHIKSITDEIKPAVEKALKNGKKHFNLIEESAHINVQNVVEELKTSNPILAEKVKKGELKILGAYYDLESGKVEWMK